MEPRILIVDDEEDFVDVLAERLTIRGFFVVRALSGQEAIDQLAALNFDVVILDLRMTGIDGLEVLRKVKELKPITEVIMLTGHATVESAIEGLKLGAMDYLTKPCDTEVLVDKIQQAHEKKVKKEEELREEAVADILASPRSILSK
jgi:DNA-binding NtrC family response regulator